MKIRISQLWKVPAYCTAAGYIGFYLLVYALSAFAVEILPDGSATTNTTLSALFSLLLLLISLLIGFFLLRSMTKKEIFWSASITAVFLLVLHLVSLIGSSPSATRISFFLAYVTEWSRFLSHSCYLITRSDWVAALVTCLAPYLFVLFGTKE